jgi:hypothetical protein
MDKESEDAKREHIMQVTLPFTLLERSASTTHITLLFFFISPGLELSGTKVYER